VGESETALGPWGGTRERRKWADQCSDYCAEGGETETSLSREDIGVERGGRSSTRRGKTTQPDYLQGKKEETEVKRTIERGQTNVQ